MPIVPESVLRLLGTLPRHEITYTCTPRGSGRRIGIDRDADGFLDSDKYALYLCAAGAIRYGPVGLGEELPWSWVHALIRCSRA
jgi:hypothetical protein